MVAATIARPGGRSRRALRWVLGAGAAAVVAALLVLLAGALYFRAAASRFDLSELGRLEGHVRVLAAGGEPLGTLAQVDRIPVTLGAVPPHLVRAVVATEDRRFYSHRGFDPRGILRAAAANLRAGRAVEGASTITQQLARQVYGLDAPTFRRKLTEAFLAARIEASASKPQIMEWYLNRVYLGAGYHGVGAASRGYFGKDVSALTLAESALLAGIIKRPSDYNPHRSAEMAKRARNQVFDRMEAAGMITPDERRAYRAMPVRTTGTAGGNAAGARLPALAAVQRELDERLAIEGTPGTAIEAGTVVESTIVPALQDAVAGRLGAFLDARDPAVGDGRAAGELLHGAVLVIGAADGSVQATVGARPGSGSRFDRVFSARRAVGTVVSPLVFAAAIDAGVGAFSPVEDWPLDNRQVMVGGTTGILGEWGWGAADGEPYRGTVAAFDAVRLQRTGALVRLGARVGTGRFGRFLADAGVRTRQPGYPRVFVGEGGAGLAEVVLAYSAFANAGRRPDRLRIVRAARAADGTELLAPSVRGWQDVCSPEAAALARATLTRCEEVPAPGAAVVSGSSYGAADAWAVGFVGGYVVGVWSGHDVPRAVCPPGSASSFVRPLWEAVAADVAALLPARREAGTVPEEETVGVCTHSGFGATEACPGTRPIVLDRFARRLTEVPACWHARLESPGGGGGVVTGAVADPYRMRAGRWAKENGSGTVIVPRSVPE